MDDPGPRESAHDWNSVPKERGLNADELAVVDW